jgi:hypothetical protein
MLLLGRSGAAVEIDGLHLALQRLLLGGEGRSSRLCLLPCPLSLHRGCCLSLSPGLCLDLGLDLRLGLLCHPSALLFGVHLCEKAVSSGDRALEKG